MGLETKKGTSHNRLELARFSKLVVESLHVFFLSAFHIAGAQHSLFSPGLSILCLSLPSHSFVSVFEACPYGLILRNFSV